MRIEIDQSGKVEDTNRLTVVAFSNSINRSIIIPAREKKSLLSVFRKIKQPRIYISKVFAALIYLLLRDHLSNIDMVIIDIEYPGHDKDVKQAFIEICQKENVDFDESKIHFMNIGKKSSAHSVAYRSFKSRRADLHVTAEKILNLLF